MRYCARILAPIFLLLLASAPLLISDVADGASGKLIFTEVNPFSNGEGFTIASISNSDTDLSSVTVTDGEGTLRFKDIILKPHGAVTVVSKAGEDWFSSRTGALTIGGPNVSKTGSFSLANTGDDLTMKDGDTVIDSVCYGKSKVPPGWKGEPVNVKNNCLLIRTGNTDTDSAADWTVSKPGYMNLKYRPDEPFSCTVSPFTFPECDGIPIFDALSKAERRVDISIYMLTSANLVALLCDLEKRHVDVRVLLEGNVLGADMSDEYALMKNLEMAGGEIMLINDSKPGNYERYGFVHNKYAVIDGNRTIISTENWTKSNMSAGVANRGWGAIIDSQAFASYMTDIFEHDILKEFGDVKSLSEAYPNLKPYAGALKYGAPTEKYAMTSHKAEIVPAISPYMSHEAMRDLISGSSSRVYSEQLDLGSSYVSASDGSPLSWMCSAASRGADCRFILDATADAEKAESSVNMINTTTNVKAVAIKGGNGFKITHNKGLIVDEKVWLGSVNWTDNSFMNNRETAIIISSPGVTSFFLDAFMKDWKANTYEEPAHTVTSSVSEHNGKKIITVYVTVAKGNNYVWNVDGVKRTTSNPVLVIDDALPGRHEVSVSVDGIEIGSTSFEIERQNVEDGSTAWYLAFSIAVTGAIAAAFRRANNHD